MANVEQGKEGFTDHDHGCPEPCTYGETFTFDIMANVEQGKEGFTNHDHGCPEPCTNGETVLLTGRSPDETVIHGVYIYSSGQLYK